MKIIIIGGTVVSTHSKNLDWFRTYFECGVARTCLGPIEADESFFQFS